jgi:hypothetical protein
VNIQVTGGPIWFGEVISNYGSFTRFNPSLTPEQQAIVSDPASTNAQLQQVMFDIANPPFTAEETALIEAATPPYSPEITALIAEHKAQLYYQSTGPNWYVPLPDIVDGVNNTWSSVTINDVEQPIDPDAYDPPLVGTWWWTLYPGDVFQGTLHIASGVPAP